MAIKKSRIKWTYNIYKIVMTAVEFKPNLVDELQQNLWEGSNGSGCSRSKDIFKVQWKDFESDLEGKEN